MKKEYYITRWKCRNCNSGYPYGDEEIIPKGTTCEQHFKKTECPTCGCKGERYSYGGTWEASEEEVKDYLESLT